MEDDQQFCLRWNNHQSTLVAVFDSLLERGQHVDVTLAAEGRTLRAHKVVLSACSPYFESILSQQFDKHPIIILKDVKFAELRAMMDYMYRGEVNISQDQLGALLKAAESLQIKGLSDNKPPPSAPSPVPTPAKMQCSNDTPCIEAEESKDGSISPTRRKRKKQRTSISSANEIPRQATPPATITNCFNANSDDLKTKSLITDNIDAPATLTKTENNIETCIEPKSEYGEDGNEDSVEDLTMDEEMDSEAEQGGIGSSQPIGDGSTQGYQWQTESSHEEINTGPDGQRDSQGESSKRMRPKKKKTLEVSTVTVGDSILENPNKGVPTVLEMSSILSQVQKLSAVNPTNLLPETGSSLSTSAKVKLVQENISQNNNIILKEPQDFKALRKCEIDSEVEYDDIDDILLPDESEVFGASFLDARGEVDMILLNTLCSANTSTDRGAEPSPQFECRHCGKRYRWKSTLRRHESVECGGKPPAHACPYCQYRAKQRGNLGVHIRKHHNAQWGTFANTKIRKPKREQQSIRFD